MNVAWLVESAAWVWNSYQAAILAAAVATATMLLGRFGPAVLGRVAPGLALFAGWAWLVRYAPAAIWYPRGWADRLPAIALAGVAWTFLHPVLSSRAARWCGVLFLIAVGWWLAAPLGQRQEYWRVLTAAGVSAWTMARLIGDDKDRAAAATLGLWGALMLLGSPVWATLASVPAAVASALLLVHRMTMTPEPGLFVLSVSLTSVAVVASLGGGFLMRGTIGALDIAALAPVLAAVLQPTIARRIGRGGVTLTVLGAAGVASGVAWLLARMVR